MVHFVNINIIAHKTCNFFPENEKKLCQEEMSLPAKTLFQNAINEYGIGHDGHIRHNATIFILSTPKTPEEPRLKLTFKNIDAPENTLYNIGFYTNETRSAHVNDDFITHISLDFVIVNHDDITYTYFDIPKNAQIVFKAILNLGDYIGEYYKKDQHVRIVLHNEQVCDSWEKFADPITLLEKIWKSTKKIDSQDTPDTTKEEQEKLRLLPSAPPPSNINSPIPINFENKLTVPKVNYEFLAKYEKLIDEIVDYEMTDLSEQKYVKQTLIDEHVDEIVDYEMTDLSEQFEKMGI